MVVASPAMYAAHAAWKCGRDASCCLWASELQRMGHNFVGLDVEAEQQRDHDARQDNVAETEHGLLGGPDAVGQDVAREHHLDGRLKGLGHRHHHVRAEDEEDVVEEQAGEQEHADLVAATRQAAAARKGGDLSSDRCLTPEYEKASPSRLLAIQFLVTKYVLVTPSETARHTRSA